MKILRIRREKSISRQNDLRNQAIERVERLKEQKVTEIQTKNREKEEKSLVKKSMDAENFAKYLTSTS